MPWILRTLAVTMGGRLLRNYLNKRGDDSGVSTDQRNAKSTRGDQPPLRVPSRRLR